VNPVTEQKTAPRSKRADAVRNRERIMAAARKSFAETGYETQMTDVARAAGVGVGTVYRHFPDKAELVEALVAERFRQFSAASADALEAEDAWAGFRNWLESCAEVQAEDRMVCDFVTEAIGEERREALVREEGLMDATARVLEHAKAAGAVRDSVEPDDIGGLMCGLGAVARRDGDDRMWRRQFEFALEGMREPSYTAT
jgi:AcrR family transcriptional regulator